MFLLDCLGSREGSIICFWLKCFQKRRSMFSFAVIQVAILLPVSEWTSLNQTLSNSHYASTSRSVCDIFCSTECLLVQCVAVHSDWCRLPTPWAKGNTAAPLSLNFVLFFLFCFLVMLHQFKKNNNNYILQVHKMLRFTWKHFSSCEIL